MKSLKKGLRWWERTKASQLRNHIDISGSPLPPLLTWKGSCQVWA